MADELAKALYVGEVTTTRGKEYRARQWDGFPDEQKVVHRRQAAAARAWFGLPESAQEGCAGIIARPDSTTPCPTCGTDTKLHGDAYWHCDNCGWHGERPKAKVSCATCADLSRRNSEAAEVLANEDAETDGLSPHAALKVAAMLAGEFSYHQEELERLCAEIAAYRAAHLQARERPDGE